ncbi:hypothetical protein P167DRAFT_566936 [Morchella conica CCBAS932]|uniref:Uncharacterized protein n=1 Tax=Morchella conica CCBAS932 TaxID=1392247 RepID=A0A3N4KVW6_9PEZI|nr:hypothetical protein P167DRAFT_566936 [Morchella conica CCBAS932]
MSFTLEDYEKARPGTVVTYINGERKHVVRIEPLLLFLIIILATLSLRSSKILLGGAGITVLEVWDKDRSQGQMLLLLCSFLEYLSYYHVAINTLRFELCIMD